MATLLVASVSAATARDMVEAARGVDADLIELRLDALADVDEGIIRDLRGGIPQPILATCRHPDEGGAWTRDESGRIRVLLDAIDAGYEYVDVEAAAADANRVIAHAAPRGARVILSAHDLAATPSRAALLGHVRSARDRGAWCGKFAVTLREPEDAEALVLASGDARRAGIRAAFMAVNDPVLRLTAPALGLALAYVHAGNGPRTAPGQVSLSAAREAHAGLSQGIDSTTRLVLLLGHPVAHSRSPAFQNAAFRAAAYPARYLAADVPPERLHDAVHGLRGLGVLGANVTVPHKVAVVPLLDALDDAARRVGAVNTIVNRDGVLTGHNTDGGGALDALRDAGVSLADAPRVLLLGAGGTARAVLHALLDEGAAVTVANRTRKRAESMIDGTAANVADMAHVADVAATCDILVNATTVGMAGDDLPLSRHVLRPGLAVLDAVYRPGGSPLIRAAAAAGAPAIPGERMLLHQGARAFTLWTGEAAPVDAKRRALDAALREASP